jgi:hypothetical protein
VEVKNTKVVSRKPVQPGKAALELQDFSDSRAFKIIKNKGEGPRTLIMLVFFAMVTKRFKKLLKL